MVAGKTQERYLQASHPRGGDRTESLPPRVHPPRPVPTGTSTCSPTPGTCSTCPVGLPPAAFLYPSGVPRQKWQSRGIQTRGRQERAVVIACRRGEVPNPREAVRFPLHPGGGTRHPEVSPGRNWENEREA